MGVKRSWAEYASYEQDTKSNFFNTAMALPTPLTTLGDEASEIVEIDKETFESNIRGGRADSVLDSDETHDNKVATSELRFINGNTLGGKDPLHQLLQEQNVEPRFWQQYREDARYYASPPRKLPRASPPDPKHYDTLPLSCEVSDRGMTSGYDIMLDPVSSDVFWATLKKRWDLSMRYETVAERREILETTPCFDEPMSPIVGQEVREDDFEEDHEDDEEGFQEEKYRDELLIELESA